MDVGCGAVKQADALHERVTVAGREPHATRLVTAQGKIPQMSNHEIANLCLFTPRPMHL
jgi:hypothetical protein